MASPRLRASPLTPGAAQTPSPRIREVSTPANGGSVPKDEVIWKRLREAGFDEETVKRRDKAALIAYITKLEAELYHYQYNMGLIILEKQELADKYEQVNSSADSAENKYKRDQAAHSSALAEAKKREENLKKALGIEKECVANIEKALHDMRAESAEAKLAYESKLVEARAMMEAAQTKFDEAENKLHSAESLHAEANRCRDTALRSIQEVEAREGDLRRRLISFHSECDAKEKELNLQRQSLYDSQKILHQEQERLLERQTLLNQREEYIFGRSRELSRLEKELEEAKAKSEEEWRSLKERKSSLDLDMAALATREEAVIKKESLLDRRERELLIAQEKISSKEHDDIQRLADEHHSALERKRYEFEAEMEEKRKLFEDEMEARRIAVEDREAKLHQREKTLQERETTVELQLGESSANQEDLARKLKLLEEKEQNLHSIEKTIEVEMLNMQKEREEMQKKQLELEKIKGSLEDEKQAICSANENLELNMSERYELLVLETKLKEEIDGFRAKKMELEVEAEKLRAEKEKFEIEWELIDEKREELKKEAECVAEERKAVGRYLKNEHDSIKLEKDSLSDQFKNDAESLSREREEFLNKMEREHTDWLIKIQREREDFVEDIKIQRKELENSIKQRHEEVEAYLREKEEAFEQERTKELQYINSEKEMIAKELEYVALELKKLDNERMQIALDREQREREWTEIKNSIEELNMQREKLEKQRELLRADREEIYQKIQQLNKLEHLNLELESRALFDNHPHQLESSERKSPMKKCSNTSAFAQIIDDQSDRRDFDDGFELGLHTEKPSDNVSPPVSSTMSWVRKYAGAIFTRTPEKAVGLNYDGNDESKFSTKFGNVIRSSKSNSFECKSGVDMKTSLSKLEYSEGPSVVRREGRSEHKVSMGRKETFSGRSDLEDAVPLSVPSVDENNESILNVKNKENTAKDMVAEKSRSTDRAVNRLLFGRKRLLPDGRADFEHSQNHQKKARQKESDVADDKAPICMLSAQVPYADDGCGLKTVNQSLECKEMPADFADKEHQLPYISSSKPPSQSGSSFLCDLVENGRSHEPDISSLVDNGMVTCDSHVLGVPESGKQVADKALEEADGQANEKAMPATELVANNGGKLEAQVGHNRVNNDEVDDEEESGDEADEDEVNMSRLGKMWIFLTT